MEKLPKPRQRIFFSLLLVSCPKNYANKSDAEPGAGTMGDAKIGGKWQLHLSPCFRSGTRAPWATEKTAPHFGKPSGLAAGSWKQSKIMQLISGRRH